MELQVTYDGWSVRTLAREGTGEMCRAIYKSLGKTLVFFIMIIRTKQLKRRILVVNS